MITIPGYVINKQLHEFNGLKVYQGQTIRDGLPLIIKAPKEDPANPADLSKMIYEFNITRGLDIDGIIPPLRLEQTGASLVLIYEDTRAISLRTYLQNTCLDIPGFLSIAIQLAKTLEKLHEKGIVHQALNPDKIVIGPETDQVKIIDFSMASHISHENHNNLKPSIPTGTLAYSSPEQLGLMHWAIDYRSDFYSLGAIFYEVLTGELPLQWADHIQWVHTKLAQKPLPPEAIKQEIPSAISGIIMKLLERNPEDRYQTARGLVKDLEECQRQWRQTGAIDTFPLARLEISRHFQLPQKLYGRTKERKILSDALDCVCAGQPGLILINGEAGAGKTALVNETLKPLVGKQGYFISGKFDQIQRNTPYVPFIQAFSDLIRQILTESPDSLAAWKKRLHRALGRSGAVISELIPEIELIMGPQPLLEALKPIGEQNRFRLVFQKFIGVFATQEHPLVIFLDDLQWADPASLQLIPYLCEDPGTHYLLLIGAYRDNEVREGHPLMKTIPDLLQQKSMVRHLPLAPLDCAHSSQFVAEALGCPEEKARPLAEILYRKSGGNPFFIGQLLKMIYDEKLLNYNTEKSCWEWDPVSISELPVADDVVDLMLTKLQSLPEETQNALKMAACIGTTFDLKTLSIACDKSLAQTAADLRPSLLKGLILLAVNNNFNRSSPVFSNTSETSGDIDAITSFEFLHDRVHQAAYSLLTEAVKKAVHLKIGRLMLANTPLNEIDERVHTIMDHLNTGLDLIEDPAEKIKMADYNLLAGRKAKTSTAYASALKYFQAGLKLLPDQAWNEHYRLSYDLYLECSQCAYLCGHFETAECLFDHILNRIQTGLERAKIYALKMVLISSTGKYDEAVQLGIEALQHLGVNLPAKPRKMDFLKEMRQIKWFLKNKKVSDLLDRPVMSDPRQSTIMEMLVVLLPGANITDPELFTFIMLKLGNLSLQYRTPDLSAVGYAGIAFITGSILGDYAKGQEFARAALKQNEKYANSYANLVVNFIIGGVISHWTAHGKNNIDYLQRVIHYGCHFGELFSVGYAFICTIECNHLLGISLDEIYQQCLNGYNYAKQINHQALLNNSIIYQQLILKLKGWIHDLPSFMSEEYDEDYFLSLIENDNSAIMNYYFSKLQLHYLYGDYAKALVIAEKIQKNAAVLIGYLLSADYNFYFSLVITAVYERLPENQRHKYWKVLQENQKQMEKWSHYCPENFLHKYLLVAAEMLRLEGENYQVMALYDQAIKSASENGYIQNQAIANELAARYYLNAGREKIARVYMTDACHGYYRWGASGKVRHLQEQYPSLLADIVWEEEIFDPAQVFKNFLCSAFPNSSSLDNLNLQTIQTIAQELCTETDPARLLSSLLETAMKSVGADKGYLVLIKGEELYIEAAGKPDEPPSAVRVPLEQSVNLPQGMVRYVARTQESVVINRRDPAGIFARDPYLIQNQVQSITCLPLIFQGITLGVLYLENSLISGVFTPDRLELLKFFSAQMAYVQKLQAYLKDETVEGEPPWPLIDFLSEREFEVLNLIAAGMSNQLIAEQLGLTINTVKTHIKRIYGKLGVNQRVQAVSRAKELKLLKQD